MLSKNKRKSVVIAQGRFDIGGYDARVYQFTRNGVSEWAWHAVNGPKPPQSWSLSEARHQCLADVRGLADAYGAVWVDVRQWPNVDTIKRQLRRRGFTALDDEFRILAEALFVFGSARSAVTWLTNPSPECRGEAPLRHAVRRDGWWRLLHVLLRKKYGRWLSQNT